MSRKQINHISIFQSSKFFAMWSFVIIGLVEIVALISGLLTGGFAGQEFQIADVLVGLLVLLVLVPLLTFIGHVILFWFYNFIASFVGGIEVEFKDVE